MHSYQFFAKTFPILFSLILLSSCKQEIEKKIILKNDYQDFKTEGKFQAGGVKMITLKEGYKVWTKRIGNNPKIKVLLLHGGPALTHEYMECFESFFPKEGIEFYHYDQLGSYRSDQPKNDSLWTLERFVEEVEQVRVALGLNKDNFFILGNSWGGILAMEYALKYQQNLKGLIISNMTADFDKYEAYNAKLRQSMRKSLIDSLEYFEKKNDYLWLYKCLVRCLDILYNKTQFIIQDTPTSIEIVKNFTISANLLISATYELIRFFSLSQKLKFDCSLPQAVTFILGDRVIACLKRL
jgi:hypothetical protein